MIDRGRCYCCGGVGTVLRLDKHQKPWIFCEVCGCRTFTRLPMGAQRMMARMVLDANGDFPAGRVMAMANEILQAGYAKARTDTPSAASAYATPGVNRDGA